MAVDVEEEFLRRYQDELNYLRKLGSKYAQTHPRIAKRLELTDGPCPDPHVERLLEGVAFLTARIQNTLEAEQPEVTQGLLSYLYPHFAQPVPSMAMAQFSPEDAGAGLTSGVEIPRHTKLYVETSFQKRTCRFRTCFPVTLWPIEVKDVRFENPSAYQFTQFQPFIGAQAILKVRLKTTSVPLSELELNHLRFFLQGDNQLVGALYELFNGDLGQVVVLPGGKEPPRGSTPSIAWARPGGFGEDEDVLPSAPNAMRGYGLLQEYFSFPEKFLFLDVGGITTEGSKDVLDLIFVFTKAPRRRLSLSTDTLKLGCTPVVNLFPKVSEPIYVDGRQPELFVCPDARWERTTEIHSIQAVTDSLYDTSQGRLEPLYGPTHSADDTVYWYARREPSRKLGMPGTDIWISFVDATLNKRLPERRTLRAHCLCTNRDLATNLDQGDRLNIEDGPHALVRLVSRPTQPLMPPMQGAANWRLISHLALSHLGLPDGPGGIEALREQLRVYSFSSAESIEPQLQALEELRREVVSLRSDENAWRGFVRVQRMTLKVDEDRFSGISPVLLAGVLRQFFGLYASVNVFTQVVLESRQREGIWKKWPPLIHTTER